MRNILALLIIMLFAMDLNSQNKMIDRQPVAAGRFYPAGKESLSRDISGLFAKCKKTAGNQRVRALISPHAGYVFSGRIAASALSAIPEDHGYDNIFIIGTSHVMAFDGASVYHAGDFVTPLGKAVVNKDIANRLRKEHRVFNFPLTAHDQEHSIEVQIPLIQHYFSTQPEIVPIIIGSRNDRILRQITNALRPWFTPDNLFIISSDFSHYPSYKDAGIIDDLTAEGLISGDPETFLETLRQNSKKNIAGLSTSMCAHTSGLVLLYLAEKHKNLEFKRIDYCNSGDSPFGDKDGVVGYHAIALVEKGNNPAAARGTESDFSFTKGEIRELFSIARNNIKTVLEDGKRMTAADQAGIPAALRQPLGAFVTIRIDGKLRGCTGRFTSSDPLCEVVRSSAISSAFEDPRFKPLTSEEYKKCDLEITVLGPLKKIKNIDEIILGKHGIYIRKGQSSGTMLPQVATEQGWNVEEFLGYTSREKAGLDWDGWKDAEIYIYEGLVLGEKSN